MEAFSMPQLEKPALVYSETQCQGDEPASRRQTPGNAKKYAGSAPEPLPLLTSSAWSAVIHRPAEEDSEPDDLPSTVDMDAIKGSPTAALAPPSKAAADCCDRGRRRLPDDASDSSEDDSDSSDSASDSASDSGSESGSCSWSESDSGSTSCSSRSCSSQASRVHQTFSIRETNIDQGGLKLKISALKIPRKVVTKEASRSSDVETKRRESPLEKQFKEKAPVEKKEEASAATETSQSVSKVQRIPSAAKSNEVGRPRADAIPNQVPSCASKVDKVPAAVAAIKVEKNPVPKSDKGQSTIVDTSKGDRGKADKCPSASQKVDRVLPLVKLVKSASGSAKCVKVPIIAKVDKGQAVKGKSAEPSPSRGSANRATRSETIRADNRRKDTAGRHKVSGVGSGRGVYNMRLPNCPAGPRAAAARAASPRSCSSDSEQEGAGIAQLARQLVGAAGQDSISISEHLQVINQEDLAAILPDVVPAQDDGVCGAPFDGFEDVSSESGKAAQRGTESSSDVELPEQVVSAAIERIQLGGDGDGDTSSGGSGDDDSAAAVGHPYSSSLLQQFVEKTKLLSCQPTESSTAKTKATEAPKRRKRGRPPKAAKRPPEMEPAYMQLDLSVSNVSPDSGIQSVAGSPPRRSLSPPPRPVATPPTSPGHQEHLKARPKFAEIRRGPGRPKKTSSKKGKAAESDFASGTDSCDEVLPTQSLGVVKRGPGRPKKRADEGKGDDAKEVNAKKEIMSSIEKMMKADKGKRKERKGTEGMGALKQPKSSAMLNEICERVSKRLDMPINDVTSYPLKLAKVRLSKEFARDGKARRKRRGGDDGRRRRFSSSSPGESHSRPPPPSAGGSSAYRAAGPPTRRAPRPAPPAPLLPTRPRLASRPHKHKKRRRKAKQLKTVRLPEDPALLTDLERLASLFRRACTIAASRVHASRDGLPSIFHVKRVAKRRKAATDKPPPPASDRESAGEEKEKRRRVKKSTVEPPKGHHERTEPANNDQRLPLKKRHYHMSVPSASTPSQDSPSSEKASEKTSAKVSPEGTRKSLSGERTAEKSLEKPAPKWEKSSAKVCSEATRKSLSGERTTEKIGDKPATKAEKSSAKISPEGTRKSLSGERMAEKSVDKPSAKLEKSSAKVSPEGFRKSLSGERTAEKSSDKLAAKLEKSSTSNKNGQIDSKAKTIAESHRNSRSSLNSERLAEKLGDKSLVKAEKNVGSGKSIQVEKAKVPQDLPRKPIEGSRKSASSERNATDPKAVVKVEKTANLPSKASQETKAGDVSSEHARNSIDEAIEACINKYASPVVATTPKKRHRLLNPVATSPRNSTTTKAKDVDVKSTSATPQPSKRSTSRSASAALVPPPLPTQDLKPIEGIFEPSKSTFVDFPTSIPAARTVVSSKLTPPSNKANILNTLANNNNEMPTQTEAPLTSTASKSSRPASVIVNDTPLDKILGKPLTVSVENSPENVAAVSPRNGLSRAAAKSPRPSPSATKTVSPKGAEVLAVTEISSEETPSHNLRLKRPNGAPPEEPIAKSNGKKKKMAISLADVKIQVTKVDPDETGLKEPVAVGKKKVRRRKAINRTGFPVKKKKKKKPQALIEALVEAFVGEDCEALIPKSIISVINKDDVKSSPSESFKTSDIVDTDVTEPTETDKCEVKEPASQLDETISRVVDNKDDPPLDGEFSQKQLEMDLSVLEPEILLYERTRKRKRDAAEAAETAAEPKSLAQCPVLKRFRKGREEDADSDILLPDDAPSCDESTKSSGVRKKQPRWRKKYLVAGLFSDYYKEEEPRSDAVKQPRSQTYRPEEHKYGLLPPPYHCGKYIRQRKVEFKLPYDMWWQHMHSQLPGRDLVPSWNYKKIRTNVYFDVKPSYGYEAQACNCAPASVKAKRGCGDDCINRVVYSECSPQLCPCREYCANQKIQRHEWAPALDKFMTKEKGWGVKTKQLIRSGEFILEYVGEVVSEKEFKERMASRYMLDTHHYCLHLDGGLVIDGHRMGGDGRFVNHSCEPNCEMQKWSVNGLFRMALFALRDITPDEELSYDYNFSLFNPSEGQPCKCGSDRCRGVIGGKSQRVNGPLAQGVPVPGGADDRRLVGRPRKNSRKSGRQRKRNGPGDLAARAPARPMSHQQRCFAQAHHCFLLRNLEKVKRVRERQKEACRREAAAAACARPPPKHADVFLTQLTALSSPRNMRTRRLAQAEDNPELTKTARLAYVFRDLYNVVTTAKDEVGEMLAAPFTTLPAKRKLPAYYQRVVEPIDLTTLEQNIVTGAYRSVDAFDADMLRLFANNVRFFGRTSELGIVATRLRKVYNLAKADFLGQLEEILGESAPVTFIPEHDIGGEEEDVIRCICGLYKDEGTMIQCERCLVWQHCDCVRADQGVEHYLCERCDRRPVDLEIRLEEAPSYATPGLEYYVTLLRGTLQLRQGDTVYVLRDMDEEGTPASQPPVKVTYKTVKEVKFTDLDIFRIERLWKDEKGDRFAFGHHFLRPHETYHEPSRKFFPNEVMRVPLYEVVPVELIMGQCWVLDVNTYCKGRPAGVPEQHVYVCEYRVDKSAHLFTRIARPRYPVCTKSYAFDSFDVRVKPVRTYTPHGRVAIRSRGPRGAARDGAGEEVPPSTPQPSAAQPQVPPEDEEEHIPLARVRAALAAKRATQKVRLNNVLLKLLARLPSKQPLDVSYLLEPGRRHRKKAAVLNT